MVDFRHFDLGSRLILPPKTPHFEASPTFFGLKIDEIWVFGRSNPQESDLQDPQMRKEVLTRPQISLDIFLENFSCGALVRTGES